MRRAALARDGVPRAPLSSAVFGVMTWLLLPELRDPARRGTERSQRSGYRAHPHWQIARQERLRLAIEQRYMYLLDRQLLRTIKPLLDTRGEPSLERFSRPETACSPERSRASQSSRWPRACRVFGGGKDALRQPTSRATPCRRSTPWELAQPLRTLRSRGCNVPSNRLRCLSILILSPPTVAGGEPI